MKKDIRGRADIELFVDAFYDKVKKDPVIGYIFTEVAKMNWEKHLPIMYDFWENAIFYTGNYTGNPMDLHLHLHRVMPLRPEHFQQWNYLFVTTMDELFSGEKASLAKQRALSISAVMQAKIFNEQTNVS